MEGLENLESNLSLPEESEQDLDVGSFSRKEVHSIYLVT